MHLDGFLLWLFHWNLYKITQIVRLLAIMYLAILSNMLTKSSDMLNKTTWGVKKVRGQEEPATKNSDIK